MDKLNKKEKEKREELILGGDFMWLLIKEEKSGMSVYGLLNVDRCIWLCRGWPGGGGGGMRDPAGGGVGWGGGGGAGRRQIQFVVAVGNSDHLLSVMCIWVGKQGLPGARMGVCACMWCVCIIIVC